MFFRHWCVTYISTTSNTTKNTVYLTPLIILNIFYVQFREENESIPQFHPVFQYIWVSHSNEQDDLDFVVANFGFNENSHMDDINRLDVTVV